MSNSKHWHWTREWSKCPRCDERKAMPQYGWKCYECFTEGITR